MKILVINGSPKGKRSNSLRLTEAFLKGLSDACEGKGEAAEVCQLNVASLNIGACKGCFGCWKGTPGKCCIHDDMQMVIEREVWADVIVWSFPLYYFNVPGSMKNLIDRQLPMNLPFMSERKDGYGSGSHASRYDMTGKRYALISTCGFYSAAGNYDSVRSMFDHVCGKGRYETIFCGQGELFGVEALAARTDEYLARVQQAGAEFASGAIAEETKKALAELLYPKDVFEEMADASWGISKETGEKVSPDLTFTRQMAALYNPASYDGKDRVLEICYTDLGNIYQILLGKDGSKFVTDGSLTATTRIDTPFDVWKSLSRGEMRGDVALAKQLYRVSGDFSLMMNWDTFFGGQTGTKTEAAPEKTSSSKKKPTMVTMLIPWITLWVAVAINAELGAVITLLVCALLPLVMRRHAFVLWDELSIGAVGALSFAAYLTGRGDLATNIGYLCFGLMWLGSCLTKEPLCAAYVKYNYHGDDALNNPIFMKTNYILAAAWGVLYILETVWTWLFHSAGLGIWVMIINNANPVFMGIFTAWFEKWYPAYVAGGGRRK